MALGTNSGFETASLGTLTAAGTGTEVLCGGVNMTYQVTVSGIGTNVVIRLEGSLNQTNWFNLSNGAIDYTLTANGTYGFSLAGAPVQWTRLRLVSFSGGTPSVTGTVGAM